MPSNTAAYITAAKAKPLVVKEAPYTAPADSQIVVRSVALAINPVDWMIQENGTTLTFNWLKYPFVLGIDLAGEVVEIGSKVTHLKVGDRVLGHAAGQDEKRNNAAQGAFQRYVVLESHMASRIPDDVSYEDASVLPLGLSTAACGLYERDQLNLDTPSPNMPTVMKNKTVIIWGGSTSVGTNAIQLATRSGYTVLTTCSPKNFSYCQSLGAMHAFDYNSPNVVADIAAVISKLGYPCVGALSIGQNAAERCFEILSSLPHHITDPQNGGRKFVSMATYPQLDPGAKWFVIPRTIVNFLSWTIRTTVKGKLRGIGWKLIFATTLVDNGVGEMIYKSFLPQALAVGGYKCLPKAEIFEQTGLEAIQGAMDKLKDGNVSAKKIVVMV